jgi:thioredoxin 1
MIPTIAHVVPRKASQTAGNGGVTRMAGPNTLEFTDENFEDEVLKSEQPVLVDFWAEWCMPCRMMAPVLNEVAEDNKDNAAVYKLNVEEQQQVAAQYGIRNIPTMILFRDGKEVERVIGVKSREYLNSRIANAQR